MKAAIRAEIKKVFTTRSIYGLLLAGLVLEIVATIVGVSTVKAAEIPARFEEMPFLTFGPSNVGLLMVLLGIRAFGDEFAHRTITSTLLADPDRNRILAAKAIVYGSLAAVFTIVAEAVMIPAVVAVLDARDLAVTMDVGIVAGLVGRSLAATMLWALIGVSAGSVVRNRVAMLVGTVIWLLIAETALRGLLPSVGRFLPGEFARALTQTSATAAQMLEPLAAGVALAGFAAMVFAGGVISLRRDVAA
jgi:ABC-2 type transport system permease protein